MKKLVLIMATLLAVGSAMAQGAGNGHRWSVNAGAGAANYLGYPAISLFDDATPNYLATTMFAGVGYNVSKHNMVGLQLQESFFNTANSLLSESATVLTLSATYRTSLNINGGLDAVLGLELGGLMVGNSYTYGGTTYTPNRYGLNGAIVWGLNYRFGENSYIGLETKVFGQTIMGDKPALQPGLSNNSRSGLSGIQTLLTFGLKF